MTSAGINIGIRYWYVGGCASAPVMVNVLPRFDRCRADRWYALAVSIARAARRMRRACAGHWATGYGALSRFVGHRFRQSPRRWVGRWSATHDAWSVRVKDGHSFTGAATRRDSHEPLWGYFPLRNTVGIARSGNAPFARSRHRAGGGFDRMVRWRSAVPPSCLSMNRETMEILHRIYNGKENFSRKSAKMA